MEAGVGIASDREARARERCTSSTYGRERLALAGRAGANVGAGLSSARGRGRFGLSGSGNTDVARSPAGSERELERRKVREQTGAALREDERELEHRKVRERADDDRLGGRERERGFEHRKVNEDASVSSEAERAAGTRARTGASRGEPGRGRCWIRSDLDLEHRKVNEGGSAARRDLRESGIARCTRNVWTARQCAEGVSVARRARTKRTI